VKNIRIFSRPPSTPRCADVVNRRRYGTSFVVDASGANRARAGRKNLVVGQSNAEEFERYIISPPRNPAP
jgi:hypothetical protein